MEGGSVTTNPWLIAVINMTIVFGVLIILGLVMNIIRWVDPTKKKKAPQQAKVQKATVSKEEEEKKVAAIAAAIVASEDDDAELAAVSATLIHKFFEPMQLPRN